MFKQYGITDVLTSEKDKLHSTLEEKVANDELTFTVASSRDTNRARLLNSHSAIKKEADQYKSELIDAKKRLEALKKQNEEQSNRIDSLERTIKNIELHGYITKEQLEAFIRVHESMLQCGNQMFEMVNEMKDFSSNSGLRTLKYTNPDLNNYNIINNINNNDN